MILKWVIESICDNNFQNSFVLHSIYICEFPILLFIRFVWKILRFNGISSLMVRLKHLQEFFQNQFYVSRLTMTYNQNLTTTMENREITFSFFCVILGTGKQTMIS